MSEFNYCYYVSYVFGAKYGEDNSQGGGFGGVEMHRSHPMNTYEQINSVADWISENKCNGKPVCINFFTQIEF